MANKNADDTLKIPKGRKPVELDQGLRGVTAEAQATLAEASASAEVAVPVQVPVSQHAAKSSCAW